jgi:hypothetical protein
MDDENGTKVLSKQHRQLPPNIIVPMENDSEINQLIEG